MTILLKITNEDNEHYRGVRIYQNGRPVAILKAGQTTQQHVWKHSPLLLEEVSTDEASGPDVV